MFAGSVALSSGSKPCEFKFEPSSGCLPAAVESLHHCHDRSLQHFQRTYRYVYHLVRKALQGACQVKKLIGSLLRLATSSSYSIGFNNLLLDVVFASGESMEGEYGDRAGAAP